jgi:hypothetical protein
MMRKINPVRAKLILPAGQDRQAPSLPAGIPAEEPAGKRAGS